MSYFVPGVQCAGAPRLEERHHADCFSVRQGEAGQPREQLLQFHAAVFWPEEMQHYFISSLCNWIEKAVFKKVL